MSRRVVVTGLGVVAPNGNGIRDFELALRKGRSGIRFSEVMESANFACRVAGVPQGVDDLAEASFGEDELLAMNMSHRYAALATLEAWNDGGLERPARDDDRVDWDSGAILGTGIGGMDTTAAKVVPLLALGNQVTTNSSACSTGTEAIAMGAERIRAGQAERMLCGGAEAASHYIWAGFDAMRVLSRSYNDEPEKASRPMSASAAGFVPGAGAGVLLLESLESAVARGARIYGEMLGSAINCGGHRGGGSMTAPNPESVVRCVRAALADATLDGTRVDAISGHLTATGADPGEVACWSRALGRGPDDFPGILSTKSLIGHTLGAAGALESVAAMLMLRGGFLHPSVNCDDVHPEIEPFAAAIPHTTREQPELRVMVKAGFGFGDVNACLVLSRWEDAERPRSNEVNRESNR